MISSKNVGLIGLGNLGLQIAHNLISFDFTVAGYRRGEMDHFVAAGGIPKNSPYDVARHSDIVFTCLPSAESLADVVSGPQGIAKAARPGSIVVELSTISIEAKHEQLEILTASGADMLDCTINGSPEFVLSRTAACFVSGDQFTFEKCRSAIEGITDIVKFVGEFGAGSSLKSISTALVSVHTLAAAEAIAMGERAGLNRQDVFNAVKGTPASSGMFETRGKAMVDGDYPKTRGLASYYKRNLEKVRRFADGIGGTYPLLSAALDCYAEAISHGFGNVDYSAVIEHLMKEKIKQ